MIISGLVHPEDVLKGGIHLVGGVIALGPSVAGERAGVRSWARGVTITSDQNYLTGKKVPPLTPNIVDVRVRNFRISAQIEQ